MLELRAALTLLMDRLDEANEKRIRGEIAKEGLEKQIEGLLQEAGLSRVTIRSLNEKEEALGEALARRVEEIAQAKEHKRKQEAACAKLYSAVENLIHAVAATGKLDREEIERRRLVVRAEMTNAFDYCDQIPF